MHNSFITRHFDWGFEGGSQPVRLLNRLLRVLGKRARVRAPYSTGYMTSLEQRINLYHLVSQILAYRVPGDLVEIGSFVGETAVLIAKIMEAERGGGRRLHVYDSFHEIWNTRNPSAELKRNFAEHRLPLPEIHAGWFKDTIPRELPARIAFAHVDCGFGGDPAEHKRVLLEVMAHLYRRLQPGAICSIVDYCDHSEVPGTELAQPAVKPAFDEFMADKPEAISVLYAH